MLGEKLSLFQEICAPFGHRLEVGRVSIPKVWISGTALSHQRSELGSVSSAGIGEEPLGTVRNGTAL